MDKRTGQTLRIPWSIASRLRPPAAAVSAIARPHLLTLLDQVPGGGTAIIAAPAGFGKTTLLAQYFGHAPRSTWLTIGKDDADPTLFLHHLRYALDPSVGKTDTSPESPFGLDAQLQLATLLDPAAQDEARPITLCVDEYDVIESPAIDSLTADLIEHLPPHLRLIICSRRPLSFPLTKLKATGRVLEIDAFQLRFDPVEAATLLGGVTSESQTATIFSQTEGWPIALQLARLWLEMHGSSANQPIDLGGEVSDIARYFAEQVLKGQPEEVQALLRACSILEDIDADLVDAMRGRGDSEALLQALAPLDPLVLRVAGSRPTYRMHNLLKRMLQRQLEQVSGSEEVTALHGRAARWYHRAGRLSDALRHAAEAGDDALAIEIYESTGGTRSVIHIGSAGIRALCATVPASAFAESTRLQLARCIALATGGAPAEANHAFQEILRKLDAGERNLELAIDLQIVEIYVAIYGDIEVSAEMLARAEAMVDELGGSEPEFRFCSLLFLTIYYQQYGNLIAAERRLEELRRHGEILSSPFTTLCAEAYRGLITYARGDLAAAKEALQGALARVDGATLRSSIYYIASRIFLAEVLYEENEVAEALDHLRAIETYLERGEVWFDAYAAGFGLAARAASAIGSVDDAVIICERMRELARQRRFPRLHRFANALHADLCSRAGRYDDIEEIIHGFSDVVARRSLAHRDLRTWREYDGTASAIIRWSTGKGLHDLAFGLIDEYEARGRREHRRRPVVKSHLFRAMLHQQRGDLDAALASLRAAVEIAAIAGLRRTLLDEGEPIERLVRRGMATNFAVRLDETQRLYLADLYGDLAGDGVAEAAPLFSQREYDVLAELSQGRSNKLIGRRLNMTENTVKTHLKRIYAKLDVADRGGAVDRFRSMTQTRRDQRDQCVSAG